VPWHKDRGADGTEGSRVWGGGFPIDPQSPLDEGSGEGALKWAGALLGL